MELLLIEDDENVAKTLALAYASEGHHITVLPNAEDGLSYLDRTRPDIVLLDVRLPGMNGIAMLRRVRERDHTLPVVLITGDATGDEVIEARQLGVLEVIEKPFVLKHLSEALVRMKPS